MKRFLWLGAVLVLFVVCVGCGQVFRPIIIPNPPQFPNPAAAHTVVTISDNGTINAGSIMVVDVSGDSDSGNRNMGLNPVHAVQQTASQMLIVNQSNSTKPSDSVSKVSFSGTTPQIAPIPTITLPPSYDGSGNLVSAAPNFVATTESTQAYVLMPLYQPPNQNNIGGTIMPSVAVINTSQQDATVTTLPVGTNPIAMAETPDGAKLYVANAGNGTTGSLSAFNTLYHSARPITGAPTAAPVWLSARSDSQQVYVLESDGTLGYLDTALMAGDTFTETTIKVPMPLTCQSAQSILSCSAIMWYDVVKNRLYIPGGDQLAIIDVSGSAPLPMTTVPITIPVVQPTTRLRSDPCSKTSAASAVTTVAVTLLPDGTRAYVGAYYSDGAGNICPQVTVITTSNNTIKSSLAIPGFPDATLPGPYNVPVCASTRFRITMAAGGDSSRAYLASCDGGGVNIIYTSTDSYIESMAAPNSARNPIQGTSPPPQNPVFMIAGP